MLVHKETVILPMPVEKVFAYITTPSNFPLWIKDIWISGRTFGKMGPGCSMIQTIRMLNPRKFNMKVTGYLENRYFKIEALKGFLVLPCFIFSCKPSGNSSETELTVSVELGGKIVIDEGSLPKNFWIFYPQGVSQHWKIYLQLLREQLIKKGKEVPFV